MKLDCREKGRVIKNGVQIRKHKKNGFIFLSLVVTTDWWFLSTIIIEMFFLMKLFLLLSNAFCSFLSVWVCKKDFVGGKNRQFCLKPDCG